MAQKFVGAHRLIKLRGNFHETLADLLAIKPPPKPEKPVRKATKKAKKW